MARIVLLFLVFPSCFLLFPSVSCAEFLAAAATRIVTPNPLLPVSGGVGASQPAHTKQGELTVRALVLASARTKVAIASGDFLGFPAPLGDKVRALIPGIPPQNILIGATHTHSAPDTYGFPSADDPKKTDADLGYLERVCRQMAEAINEANERLEPVGVKIAVDKAEGKIAFNYYAEDLYDPRVGVIQFVRPNGTALATLVNYAIHPEIIGDSQGILSPDLCGPLYGRIEEKGGGTAIFMNGAQGGMITADNRGPNGTERLTWEECQRIGTRLADEALRVVASVPAQEAPSLHNNFTMLKLPIESKLMRTMFENVAVRPAYSKDWTVTTQVNLVTLGNAQILTIPGEALPNIGYYLKRKMRGEHNFLFGLTNDAFGYILTRVDYDSFDRYRYITTTSLGENTGEIFMEKTLKLVNSAPSPDRTAP